MANEDWMPGLVHRPGANAGYNAGRPRMDTIVLHYTAGAYGGDSAVGLDGYFNFYCPRDKPAEQYAEGDALTYHAGEWNDAGPGIELERRDDSVAYTDHQLDDLGRIVHWINQRYGIPLDRFYDTGGDNNARQPEGATAGMCITHRSLAQSGGWHSDYLTHDEWNRALGGAAPAPDPIEGDDETMMIVKRGTSDIAIITGNHRPRMIASVNDYHNGTWMVCDAETFDQYWWDALKLYDATVGGGARSTE